MKFDLIISNPPYNRGLHLKILESILNLADNICFVHPSGWLNLKHDIKNTRDKIIGRVSSFEFFNCNPVFGILNYTPCVITMLSKHSEKILVIDNFHSNTEYEVTDIYDVHKYGYKSVVIKDILNKLSRFPKITSKLIDRRKANSHLFLGLSLFRGHPASSDFYTIVQKNKTPHFNNPKYHQVIPVKNENELENLYSFFKLKIVRFFLSLKKEGLHIEANELKMIPLLDFSRSWTDEQCAEELGITDEELLWIIQQIPDYYPEDTEVYRKLEEKLKEKIKNVRVNSVKLSKITSKLIDRMKANPPLFFSIGPFRGNFKDILYSDFYTIVQKTKTPHFNNPRYPQIIPVKNEDELENLYNFLKLKIVRFFLSIRKEGIRLRANEMEMIPLLDFSRSWTDEECAKELGITDEELLWIIQQIPDYYLEDAEVYRKLEEKLGEKINNNHEDRRN